MPRLAVLSLVALSLAACDQPPAQVTTADALADRMEARFEANVGALSALSVTAAGVRADFEATADSGAARLVPSFAPVDSAAYDPAATPLLGTYLPNIPGLAEALRTGTFVGQRSRGGRSVYVASTTDPALTGGAADGVARSARVFVDPETFDVLEVEQSARVDSFPEPFTRQLVYEDFREVDGVRVPFRVRQLDRGQTQQLSEDDLNARRMVLGGQLALQRQQTQQLPAGAERDEALAEVDREIQNLEAGVQEVVLRIDSVRVVRDGGL